MRNFKIIRVMVLMAPGSNCERETMQLWKLAGANPKLVQVDDILKGKVRITDCDIFCVVGGFSYGDHLGTGTIVIILLRDYFPLVREAGIPIVGECNGSQITVKANLFGLGLSLAENEIGVFQSLPTTLHRIEKSDNIWVRGLEGRILNFPAAHHCGRFVGLADDDPRVLMTFAGHSPNGGRIAAIGNDAGNSLAIMCHMTRPYDNPDGILVLRNGMSNL